MITQVAVKIKKLSPAAQIPTYGTDWSAGADLYAVLPEPLTIAPHETKFINTGLALEIPAGLVGLIYARSGLGCKQDLAPANKVAVIDSDYRGEVLVALHNHGAQVRTINPGDRIAQMVFTPYVQAQFQEVNTLATSVRGAGGFGHTGN